MFVISFTKIDVISSEMEVNKTDDEMANETDSIINIPTKKDSTFSTKITSETEPSITPTGLYRSVTLSKDTSVTSGTTAQKTETPLPDIVDVTKEGKTTVFVGTDTTDKTVSEILKTDFTKSAQEIDLSLTDNETTVTILSLTSAGTVSKVDKDMDAQTTMKHVENIPQSTTAFTESMPTLKDGLGVKSPTVVGSTTTALPDITTVPEERVSTLSDESKTTEESSKFSTDEGEVLSTTITSDTETQFVSEELGTSKATAKPILSTLRSETEDFSTSEREEHSTSTISTTEIETVSEKLETLSTTPKPDLSTIIQKGETIIEVTTSETSQAPSSTLATREDVKENVTEMLTKGFKAIITTPIPYTTTHLTDSETTTTEETDYIEDETNCYYQGRMYLSAEQIPREDPCEFCFCFRGDIICLQQSCPPPLSNCEPTSIPGFCCPRYECRVYLTSANITQVTRRKGATPIMIHQKRIDKREIPSTIEVKGCEVNGTFYELGKTVTSASGPCLHCACQEDGIMHCDPQRCKPQPPLMLKMNNSFFKRR